MPVMLDSPDEAAIIAFALGAQLDAERLATIFPPRAIQAGEARPRDAEASARTLLADCLAAVATNIANGALLDNDVDVVPLRGRRG